MLYVIKRCQVLVEKQLMAFTAREFVFLYPLPAQPSFPINWKKGRGSGGRLPQCDYRTRNEYSAGLFSKDLWSFTINNHVLNMVGAFDKGKKM